MNSILIDRTVLNFTNKLKNDYFFINVTATYDNIT